MKKPDIKTIVVHARCPDGIASAMVLQLCHPEATTVELAYGPDRDNFPVSDGLLFCDMSPPAARAQLFIDAGAWVLDHPDSTKEPICATLDPTDGKLKSSEPA